MSNTFFEKFITDKKHQALMKELMWGPNGIRQAEELASHFNITKGVKILDLGCGPGLSSLYLAMQHGALVFATDLFMDPTENQERFESLCIADKIIPMMIDATKPMPFAKQYFDVIFSVGAYNVFGDCEDSLPNLMQYMKKGGYLAASFPGLKYDFGENVPPEMQPFWDVPDVAKYIRGIDWWRDLWSKAQGVEIINISEQTCHDIAWREYLANLNPDEESEKWDLDMMEAEAGKYFNTIQLVCRKPST